MPSSKSWGFSTSHVLQINLSFNPQTAAFLHSYLPMCFHAPFQLERHFHLHTQLDHLSHHLQDDILCRRNYITNRRRFERCHRTKQLRSIQVVSVRISPTTPKGRGSERTPSQDMRDVLRTWQTDHDRKTLSTIFVPVLPNRTVAAVPPNQRSR